MTLALGLLGAFAIADVLAAVYATRSSSGVGRGIVFQARVHGAYQLFTVDPDGGHLRQITDLRSSRSSIPGAELPAWSPDGRRIIFDSDYRRGKQGEVNLFTIEPNGRGLEQVFGIGMLAGAPAFSPDGKRISFDWDADVTHGIDIADADGAKVRRLTAINDPIVVDGHSVWSPSGRWIAFTELRGATESAILTLRTNGSGRRQLTRWPLNASNAAWSPDGRWIAFNSHNTPVPEESSNIYVVGPNGRGLRQLTHYEGGKLNAYMGDWSPDSRQIVFHLRGPDPDGLGVNQLFVMDANGHHVRRLTHLPRGSNPQYARWSPAG